MKKQMRANKNSSLFTPAITYFSRTSTVIFAGNSKNVTG
jgi:hypothetical protein